ncbi:hypothetical protein HK100_000321 [Physocladia obscura]|uniref:Uncharacterized protein n=1 Tax=Physocladia obscura TaxID=109957 RepID=A0AAD5T1B0_9FUNG|nr:hypothetical protein HK100_000321 [Physocladia obscura]
MPGLGKFPVSVKRSLTRFSASQFHFVAIVTDTSSQTLAEIKSAKALPLNSTATASTDTVKPEWAIFLVTKYLQICLFFLALNIAALIYMRSVNLPTLIIPVATFGFNMLALIGVKHLIPEYITVYIHYFVAKTALLGVFTIITVGLVIFFMETLISSLPNPNGEEWDPSLIPFAQTFLFAFLVLYLAFTALLSWWGLARFYIPIRDYAHACQVASTEATIKQNIDEESAGLLANFEE